MQQNVLILGEGDCIFFLSLAFMLTLYRS